MIARDQILGKAFLFPQQQQVAQQRAPQRQQAGLGDLPLDKQDAYFGIPEAKDGFQYTGKMRDKALQYYKDLAALRQFAREQWTVYGNDVTNPDPTREDAILAAEAFKAGIANIQHAADEMKVSQDMFAKDAALRSANEFQFAPGAFDQSYANVAGTPAAGQSLKVDPLVQFVGQQAGKDFTNYGQYGQAKEAVTNLQGSLTDPRAQMAAGAITPDHSPRADSDGGSGAVKRSVFEFIKRAAAVAKGVSDYKISSTEVDPSTQEPLAETKEFNDAFEGIDRRSGKEVKGLITSILRNPNTGSLYLKLSTQQELVPVSMTEFVYGISKANPKYPGVDKISSYIGEVGASDEAGNIIPESFLERTALSKAAEREQMLKQEGVGVAQQVAQVVNTVDQVAPSGGVARFFGDYGADGVTMDSKLGKLKFRKNEDGTFDLVNRKEVIKTTKDFTSSDRDKVFSNITQADMAKLVRKYDIKAPVAAEETQIDW